MARGKHLFPFRTEQLSPSAPMVLGSQEPGRVGRRRFDQYTSRPSGRLVVVVGSIACETPDRRATGESASRGGSRGRPGRRSGRSPRRRRRGARTSGGSRSSRGPAAVVAAADEDVVDAAV